VLLDSPPTVHEVDAVVHLKPPGLDVTTYCVGVGPELGAVHDTEMLREELGLEPAVADTMVGAFGAAPTRTLNEEVPVGPDLVGYQYSWPVISLVYEVCRVASIVTMTLYQPDARDTKAFAAEFVEEFRFSVWS
jgi:hypothetical protein